METALASHASEHTAGVTTLVRHLLESTARQCGERLDDLADLQRWLAWPADCFALTSYVMRTTGCYRIVLAPEARRSASAPAGADGLHLMSVNDVSRTADEWRQHLEDELTTVVGARRVTPPGTPKRAVGPAPELGRLLARFWELSGHVTMEQLRVVRHPDAKTLALVLLDLHAIADGATAGVGIISGTRERWALTYCLAHLLLVARGSLSSFPKHLGIVLPKMRTPQSGLGLRSLSHHVTFHTTEVDVVWRALPWLNRHQDSLNVLAVPWPFEPDARRLVARPDTMESVRYFGLAGRSPDGRSVRSRLRPIVGLVRAAEARSENGVHVLVLPELALTVEELHTLADMLAGRPDARPVRHVPVIVAGVFNEPRRGDATNEVHLMYYFGDRWYDVSQWKHHRWRLNRGQLLQYELHSELSTSCDWFEDIQIGQRRLTFIAANGWLTLCPLICEDLARLEPVSEVIRGVGPTLLLALLMDGPQLKARWPARYATVLAEDPGTAVLSLTSRCMTRRARALAEGGLVDHTARDASGIIGLWKDASLPSAVELELRGSCGTRESREPAAVFLSISATRGTEWTADGRSDGGVAAIFRLDGLQTITLPSPADSAAQEPTPEPEQASPATDLGTWADLRELASGAYACDAALARKAVDATIIEQMLLASDRASFPGGHGPLPQPWARLVDQVTLARIAPEESGTAGLADGNGEPAQLTWPDATLRYGATLLRALVEAAAPSEVANDTPPHTRSSEPASDAAHDGADHAQPSDGELAAHASTRIVFWRRVAAVAATGLGGGRPSDLTDPESTRRWDTLRDAARRDTDAAIAAGRLAAADRLDEATRERLERQVRELVLAVLHGRLDPNRRAGGIDALDAEGRRAFSELVNGIEAVLAHPAS